MISAIMPKKQSAFFSQLARALLDAWFQPFRVELVRNPGLEVIWQIFA
jgi:hypothetical protein